MRTVTFRNVIYSSSVAKGNPGKQYILPAIICCCSNRPMSLGKSVGVSALSLGARPAPSAVWVRGQCLLHLFAHSVPPSGCPLSFRKEQEEQASWKATLTPFLLILHIIAHSILPGRHKESTGEGKIEHFLEIVQRRTDHPHRDFLINVLSLFKLCHQEEVA